MNHSTSIREIQSILKIALPLMAAFLAQRAMQFIDTVMMGWISTTALAAGAIGTTIFITALLFCMGTLSAIGVFIVRAKGEDKTHHIKLIIQHGFYLVILLSIPFMLIIWFTPHLLLLIKEDPLVVHDVTLLLHGLVWGFPGFLLFLILREFIAAFSLTMIVMIVSLFSIPLTFIANYVLIYGKYHFPQLGISGIGYSGAIVMWFMFFCLMTYSKYHPDLKDHIEIKSFKFDGNIFKDLLYIGTPSGTLFLLEAGMFLFAAMMMGYFGVAPLAAHQIALQCVNIVYTLPVAVSMATALQIGHAASIHNHYQIRKTALVSFSLTSIFAILMAIIFIYNTDNLISLFLDKHSEDITLVHQFTSSFIKIAALFLCFDAIQSVANGALRGLKDTMVPMLLSLFCYWVLGVGGSYYLSMYTSLKSSGIWYGLTLGLSSTAIILMIRFIIKIKIEKS